jgi:hypothetical protein
MSIVAMLNKEDLAKYREYQKGVQKKFREKNPDYYKTKYEENKEKRREYARQRYHKNKVEKKPIYTNEDILDKLATDMFLSLFKN